ncbi:ABC transporter permease [Bacillus cereus]|uniref:FtsX-like permease family protein n=1 Tax=Bacillus cereus TaxID=1396 RepID=UPI001FF280E3|nr:ABC transporter permease [Bacillus cereus]MDZ4443773.1 ABC transporter permease [Bacillus cereus]UOX99176.1 ABC transporter permease [Bacillus cereus]
MLLKLSISSIRKMMKDYIVLLIGLVISISIFYMFQTLAMNTEFTKHNSIIGSIALTFQIGSILLMFVSFFYIFYANSFLLSLRRKELGMYLILGAKKNKISLLLFFETLGMGFLAIILGSMLGILLSKLVSFLLMKQLEISLEGYQAFYLPAWSKTCFFFCILFFLTSIINAIRLSLKTELHLIRTEQTIDRMPTKGLTTMLLAIVGIGGIGVGYYLVMGPGIKKVSDIQIPLLTITLGTYLLFMSLLPVLVNVLKKTSLNEKYINAFTFAQLRFRVNNLAKMLGTVTLLIGLGVGAMAGGMSLQQNTELRANKTQVYDITILNPEHADYEALENMKITEKNQYRYKSNNQAIYYLKDDLVAHPPLTFLNQEENQPHRITEKLPAEAYSMFNGNRNNQMYKTLPPEWSRAMAFEFRINMQIFNQKPVYILDQKHYTSISGSEHVFLVAKVDDFLKYKKELKEIDTRHQKQLPTSQKEEPLLTKYGMYEGMLAFSKGTVFMGFFLGIAFLAMMASCLMFKILSGATRDIERYHMLRKIGVRKELLTKSIYKELGSIFVFPAILGLIHVLVGMKVFAYVAIFTDPYINIWVPISIFLIIYTIYYWITVQLYKRIVFPKEL